MSIQALQQTGDAFFTFSPQQLGRATPSVAPAAELRVRRLRYCVVPMNSAFIGRWSEDLGYKADLTYDTCIELLEDGTGFITSPGERIELIWESPSAEKIVLTVFGNRIGPFDVRISKEELPLGKFTVLESSGALLPFDRRRFAKLKK